MSLDTVRLPVGKAQAKKTKSKMIPKIEKKKIKGFNPNKCLCLDILLFHIIFHNISRKRNVEEK